LEASDREQDPLGFRIVEPPLHGHIEGEPPNIVYVPAPGYVGPDAFRFVANDGELDSRDAEIRIEVLPRNDAPQAIAQSLQTPLNTPLDLVLSGTDPDGDALSFEIVQWPSNGTLEGEGANLRYV